MGRSILVEDYIQRKFETIKPLKPYTFGVIVGQLTHQKDYVVHIARTPPNEEAGDVSLQELNEKWIAKHACQVESMLCGGLHVVGVFVMALPDVMKHIQHKLRQVLFATHKALNKNRLQSVNSSEINDRILLQICAVSRKMTCQTFDVSDSNSSARPAEWKYQHFLDRWLSLSTHLSVDVQIPVTISMGSKSLKKQIQTGLLRTCENIQNSVGLIHNQLHKDDQLLDPGQPSKRKSKKPEDNILLRHFDVQLFTQMTGNEMEKPILEECCAQMLLRGTVFSRAFVHPKSTVKEALTALREDCRNTLVQRCDLLCEDLLSSEEEQDLRVVYETPRRVTVTLPGTPIAACDYIFIDETATESQQRLRELLDIDVSKEEINMECELLPTKEDLVKPARGNDNSSPNSCESFVSFEKESAVKSQQLMPRSGILIAIVFAVLSLMISYAYLSYST